MINDPNCNLIRLLQWKKVSDDISIHEFGEILVNELFLNYPISREVLLQQLKRCILKWELAGEEISESIYAKYISMLTITDNFERKEYKTYICSNYHITVPTDSEFIKHGTTGLTTWSASLALSDYLSQAHILNHKYVLEIGSGAGFLGITACHLDAFKVVCSDINHASIVNRITETININSMQLSDMGKCIPEFIVCDWENIDSYDNVCKPDLIICADVCYDPMLINSLVRVITFFNCTVLMAHTQRNELTWKTFLERIESSALEIQILDNDYNRVFFNDEEQVIICRITPFKK